MFDTDQNGLDKPPGQARKERAFQVFNESALPSWLTASSGTVSFADTTTSRGTCRLTTGATSGNTAELVASPQIDLARFAGILWIVESLQFSSTSGFDFEFNLVGSGSVGATFRQLTAETNARLGVNGTSSLQSLPNYTLQASGGRHTLMLAMSGKSYHVAVFRGTSFRNEIAYRKPTSLTGGLATASLKLTTRTAAARWFEFSAVRLVLFHN